MKRAMLLFLILALLVFLYVFSSHSGVQPQRAAQALQIFESTPPILNIRFGYPPGWKLSVSRARDAEEETVQLLGPRDVRRQFSASFFVIVKKQKDLPDLDKEFETILERKKQLNHFKAVSRKNIKISGEDAREVVFDFVLDLPFDAVNPRATSMREQIAVAVHAGLVYQIHFIGTREQHRENGRLFQDFLRSLQFRE